MRERISESQGIGSVNRRVMQVPEELKALAESLVEKDSFREVYQRVLGYDPTKVDIECPKQLNDKPEESRGRNDLKLDKIVRHTEQQYLKTIDMLQECLRLNKRLKKRQVLLNEMSKSSRQQAADQDSRTLNEELKKKLRSTLNSVEVSEGSSSVTREIGQEVENLHKQMISLPEAGIMLKLYKLESLISNSQQNPRNLPE